MSATHRTTQQEVAVKFIYKKKLPLSSLHLKEPLEISILKRIRHPTVIDYIGSFQDDAFFYLVMELFGCEWKKVPTGDESLPSLSSSSETIASSANSSSSPVTPNGFGPDDFISSELVSFPFLPFPQQQQQPKKKVRRSSCDLFECIERHTKLSESQTHKIFKQIVQCVYDLSNIGIYHRDIKDENIVINSDFNVRPKHFCVYDHLC